MKKFYRVIILLLVFIITNTVNPQNQKKLSKKENIFFSIKEIKIENNYLVKEEIIIKKLHKIYEKNIFFLKKNEIEEPLKQIDFLDKVKVKKIYPNKIIINVLESKPIGVIIKKNKKYIIDTSSKLIIYKEKVLSYPLPLIFGDNAEYDFVNLFYLLEEHNFPLERVKNYYYFQIGRWDLKLSNNQLIRLPADEITSAIKLIIELLNRKDFKNYNIIDLRINGKVITE